MTERVFFFVFTSFIQFCNVSHSNGRGVECDLMKATVVFYVRSLQSVRAAPEANRKRDLTKVKQSGLKSELLTAASLCHVGSAENTVKISEIFTVKEF